MSGRFEGKVVWITGGGTGLGLGMAEVFAEQGAHVVLSGRRASVLEAAVAGLHGKGLRADAVVCDVADEGSIAAAVDQVLALGGKLDVAVANAGFSVAGTVESLDAAAWRRQLDTNVIGVALTAKHVLPHLRATRGSFALVGSVSGLVFMPGYAAYQASKAAALALGRTLAAEVAADGVSVTVLQPGFVESEIGRVDNAGVHHPERADKRPSKLMWATRPAAELMVKAVYKRRVEYTFTGHGKLGAFLGRHMPGLVQLVANRMAGQLRDTAAEKGAS